MQSEYDEKRKRRAHEIKEIIALTKRCQETHDQLTALRDEALLLRQTNSKLETDLCHEKEKSKIYLKKLTEETSRLKEVKEEKLQLEEALEKEKASLKEQFQRFTKEIELLKECKLKSETEAKNEIESTKEKEFLAKMIFNLNEELLVLKKSKSKLQFESDESKKSYVNRMQILSDEMTAFKEANSKLQGDLKKAKEKTIKEMTEENVSLKEANAALEIELKKALESLEANASVSKKQIAILEEIKLKNKEEITNIKNASRNLTEEISLLKEVNFQLEKELKDEKTLAETEFKKISENMGSFIENSRTELEKEKLAKKKAITKYESLRKDFIEMKEVIYSERRLNKELENQTQTLKTQNVNIAKKMSSLKNKLLMILNLNREISSIGDDVSIVDSSEHELNKKQKTSVDQLTEKIVNDFVQINEKFAEQINKY